MSTEQRPGVMPTYEELLARESARLSDPHYQVPPVQQQPQHSASSTPNPIPQIYPNPGHVPEAMHTVQQAVANVDSDSVNAVTLKIDGESMKILMNANEIFRETIVNMGIKLASQTPVYRDYFKMENLRTTGVAGGVSSDYGVVDTPSITTTESISRVGSPIGSTVGNAPLSSTPVKKKAPGFGSWG